MSQKLKTVIADGMTQVLPNGVPETVTGGVSGFCNEPLYFQLAYRAEGIHQLPFYIRVESALPVALYAVRHLPVIHGALQNLTPPAAPGLYPDILVPKATNPPLLQKTFLDEVRVFEKGEQTLLRGVCDAWQSVLLEINAAGRALAAGDYPVSLHLYARADGAPLSTVTMQVRLLGDRLPAPRLRYTNWFHCDCLADYYRVPLWSEEFFRIFENYVRVAAANGMNTLYMPAFTPPLDVGDSCYRQVTQLVGVTRENGSYTFDFSLMRRYIAVARRAGIRYFEHSHLFTQGGATAAPQIMATVGGRYRRLFGWNTAAGGKAYTAFLQSYLPAVRAVLRELGLEKTTLFHLSDEPRAEHEQSYNAARRAVGHALDGCMVGDALWDYAFYEKGLVQTPIVSVDRVADFVGRCRHFWCYNTGGHLRGEMSNRLPVVAPARNRMLGVQLYACGAAGYLHWGYNYFYDELSNGLFDPARDPGGCGGNTGTSSIVYPAPDGTAYPSLRQKVLFMGLNDHRALCLLEKRHGRAAAEALMTQYFGQVDFFTGPRSAANYRAFRHAVNQAVMA